MHRSRGDVAGVCPVVLVHATDPAAELVRTLHHAHTTVAALFQHHAHVAAPNLLVQTVAEPYRLHHLTMRFEMAHDVRANARPLSEDDVAALLNAANKDTSSVAPDRQPLASWLAPLQAALAEHLRHSEHQAHDHPVASLFVGLVSQPNLAAAFNALHHAGMPPVLKDGIADPMLARAFVLLDDLSDPARDEVQAERSMAELTRAFGANACHVLQLRAPAATAGAPADADAQRVAALVHGPLCGLIVTQLQQRLIELVASVRDKRQGIKNTFRSWLGAKKGSDASASASSASAQGRLGGGARYPSSAIEAQLRQVGDYAYFLCDPPTALSYYKSAASEFKGDKAWLHYASAQEMVALCLHASDASRRDVDEAIEKANAAFDREVVQPGDFAARCATRSALLRLTLSGDSVGGAAEKERRGGGRRVDAARMLVAQSTQESGLVAALLLEQAARCFGAGRGGIHGEGVSPMCRQYALHMALAGYRYAAAGQLFPAARAFTAALGTYEGVGWRQVEEHARFALARNLAALGFHAEATGHFLRLLEPKERSTDLQASFMKGFLAIIAASPTSEPLAELPLPVLENASIRVRLSAAAHGPPSDGAPQLFESDPLWKALAASLRPSGAAASNWFVGARGGGGSAAAPPTPCAVGEWVRVDIVVKNPTGLELNVDNIKLHCGHALPEGATSVRAAEPPFCVDSHSLVLEPWGSSVLRLGVQPLREGQLSIKSVTWTLNHVAHGVHHLEVKGWRLNETKAHRTGRVYATDQSLTLLVVGPAPLLSIEAVDAPESVLHGEIVRMTLRLSNEGSLSMSAVRVRASTPSMALVATDGADPEALRGLDDDGARAESTAHHAVTFAEDPPTKGSCSAKAGSSNDNISVPLPNHVLQAGATLDVPVWLRAAELGAHDIHLLFCYESVDTPAAPKGKSAPLAQRFASISLRLNTTPSLALASSLQTLGARAAQGELTMCVSMEHPGEQPLPLQVSQISCISRACMVEPIVAPSANPPELSPGERCQQHLRFTRAQAPPDAATIHSEVVLGSTPRWMIDSRAPSCTLFLARDQLPTVQPLEEGLRRMAPEKPVPPPPEPADGATLVVHWQSRDGARRGQLYVRGLRSTIEALPPAGPVKTFAGRVIAPRVECVPPAEALRGSLRCTIECASSVRHDFSHSPLALVPAALLVHNRATDVAIKVEFFARQAPDGAPELSWSGTTHRKGVWIEPRDTARFEVRGAACMPCCVRASGLHVVISGWRSAAKDAAAHDLAEPLECESAAPVEVRIGTEVE